MQDKHAKALAIALLIAAWTSGNAAAGMPSPPQLDTRGRAAFESYQKATDPRAFVIAPGGTWVWHADMPSEKMAVDAALLDCQSMTQQRCVPYAINERVVFDARSWPLSWGPYLSATQAARATTGIQRGQKFPDLAITTPDGRPTTLSRLRGKVIVLHFWGSWCPPCQNEMPNLQTLFELFRHSKDVRFVSLPVRESLADARRWANAKRIDLPIYFGGASTVEAGEFPLAGGGVMHERQLAKAFPTTFVLDKQGIVVFSHLGPVTDWNSYAAFIRDTAAKSGR